MKDMLEVMKDVMSVVRARAKDEVRRGDAFDFKRVKGVDEETVRTYFATTNENTRRLPLIVAGQVYADIENALTTPGRTDALRMAEARGGMMALRRFAVMFSSGLKGQGKMRDEGRGERQRARRALD